MKQLQLQSVPSQTLSATLGNQAVRIDIYQKRTGLFCNLKQGDNTLIIGGVLCHNLNRIVRSLYLGFLGDLFFYDTQGVTNPTYTGLAGRYAFLYLEPSDLLPGIG